MPDHFYVYPAYLDRSLSRADGRRVPAGRTVAEVTADEVAQAARKLGFKAEVEAEKEFPRQFFRYAGRVKIAKKAGAPKAKTLRALADELVRLRASAGRK